MKIVEQTQTKLVLREFPWFITWFSIAWIVPIILMLFIMFFSGKFWFLFIVIGFLVYIPLNAEIVTCTFDKSLNRMILKQQTLLRKKIIERSINAISGIKLEVMTDCYRVSIMLDSGKCVPLTSLYTNDLKDKEKTAEDIAIFLNVSYYGIRGSIIPAFLKYPTGITQAELPYWQKAIHLKPSEYLSRSPQAEIAHWQALIRLNLNDAEAYRNLGMALHIQDREGNKKEVLESLKKSYELFITQNNDEECRISFYLYELIYLGEI
jgi:tetratricopeptide (TPR) repeat protein